MANYPSSIKRNRQAPRRRARNRFVLGRMRSAVKRARQAFAAGEGDQTALLRDAVSQIDRAVTKGVLKRSTASRHISRLSRAANGPAQ